jgi:hypothetical protein
VNLKNSSKIERTGTEAALVAEWNLIVHVSFPLIWPEGALVGVPRVTEVVELAHHLRNWDKSGASLSLSNKVASCERHPSTCASELFKNQPISA